MWPHEQIERSDAVEQPLPSRGAPALLMFIAGLLLMLLRAPGLLVQPRFWAEEATVYFTYALVHPWYQALLAPQFGYLSLWANLSAWLACFVPLAQAPRVTTSLALAVQLIPLAQVVAGGCRLHGLMWQRGLAVAALVLVPLAGELWLNTINSQFYLSVATFLLLLDPITGSRGRQLCRLTLLVLAGLTGVASCFLAPLFVWRWWFDRQPALRREAAVLVFCSVVQLGMFASMYGDAGVARRFMALDLPTFGAILLSNSLLWCFAGLEAAHLVAGWLLSQRQTPWFGTVGTLSLLLLFVLLGWMSNGLRRQRWFPVAAYTLLTLLSVVAATGSRTEKWYLVVPGFGGRYFYAANVIVVLLLIANLNTRTSARRVVAALLFVAALANGARQFGDVPRAGPSWPEEVARWQADPRHVLRIWPTGWTLTLPAPPDWQD